ncbi:MAG: RNA polymerase sigma factor [Akkermansiaceae bacterium]|nr:RNA polymerase sigma factor [Armatimonadota bacterium]
MPVPSNRSLAEEMASASVRRSLLSLCYAYTRDGEAAQDLVQEALIEALRRADTLPRPESWRPWLFGVARNVCRRWREDRQRHRANIPLSGDMDWVSPPPQEEDHAGISDERTLLLNRALRFLPEEGRRILGAVVVEQMSHAQAGTRFNLSPNMVAVRLHRYKQTLRRVLASEPSLRVLASEHGVPVPGDGDWRQTPFWCRWCGKNRILVRTLYRDEPGKSNHLSRVEVHCPGCNPRRLPLLDATTQNAAFDVLRNVRGYRTALNRLNGEQGNWYERLSRGETMPCWQCGRKGARLLPAPTARPLAGRTNHAVYIFCSYCRNELFASPGGIANHSAPLQQFAQKHERICILPEQAVSLEGCPALLIRFRSLESPGEISLFLRRDTFALLRSESA